MFDGIEYIDTTSRSPRYLHSYNHLNYSVGRHSVREYINIKSINEPHDSNKTNGFLGFIGVFVFILGMKILLNEKNK